MSTEAVTDLTDVENGFAYFFNAFLNCLSEEIVALLRYSKGDLSHDEVLSMDGDVEKDRKVLLVASSYIEKLKDYKKMHPDLNYRLLILKTYGEFWEEFRKYCRLLGSDRFPAFKDAIYTHAGRSLWGPWVLYLAKQMEVEMTYGCIMNAEGGGYREWFKLHYE